VNVVRRVQIVPEENLEDSY